MQLPHNFKIRKTLSLFLFLLLTWVANSQSLSISGFNELPNDLDARANYPKTDPQTGKKYAIIKIVTTQKGFTFDIGQLAMGGSDVHPELGEIWLYVPEGTKKIKIVHPQLGQLKTPSNDGFYWFPSSTKSAYCYRLELVSGTVNVVVEQAKQQIGWLVLNSTPSDADVYIKINGVESLEGKTPFQKKLAYGSYDFRIRKNLYHDEVGIAQINANRLELDATLQPAYGRLNITSEPTGADVVIEGLRENYTTPCTTDIIPSGQYRVTLTKPRYIPTSTMVTVIDGDVAPLQVNMTANFAKVSISSLQDAEIYLNGILVDTTTHSEELTPGPYEIEVRKAKHHTASRQIEVQANIPQSIQLYPTPICGSLDVVTTPIGADIYIDGKHYGKAPNIIDQLIEGEHTVVLSMDGYMSETHTVTIRENQTAEINDTLQHRTSIVILCSPLNARLYLDNQYLGQGSGKYDIAIGNHSLKAESDNYKPWQKTIEITSATDIINVKMDTILFKQTLSANGVSFTMVSVEGGTFTMGASSEQDGDTESNEKPSHSVTLNGYHISETEVTQALWKAVMGSNPSCNKGDNLPVENVSWNDCQEFIHQLNQITGKLFRLPTEAEWEYAARGGNMSKDYKYSGSNIINQVTWYDINSSGKAHPVKSKQSNELGIYDMSGNVSEWCQDWISTYSDMPQTDPQGPSFGTARVFRGGDFHRSSRYCRISYRSNSDPDYRNETLGLRLVLTDK